MASDAWQSAWVEVLPDFSRFRSQANSTMVPVLASAGTAGAASFGKSFAVGVAALGLGAVLFSGIKKGLDLTFEAIDLASGLAEQRNAVGVAFGDVSGQILDLAKLAPASLNITQAAFNKLAVRFSASARTIAGSGGNVAGIIADLTTRGADFASVYDLEVGDALQVFQSGLAGETEPLKAFGIDLSAASVQAFAYASGLAEAGRELTEAEKVQGRYGLLMEQTAATQGDLANTAGSLANQQRGMATFFEEAQTKFGEALLPGFTRLVTYLNDNVLPKLDELLAKIGPELSAALEQAGPAIEKALDFIGEQFELELSEDGLIGGTLQFINDPDQAWADFFEGTPNFSEFFDGLDQAINEPLLDFRNQLWDELGIKDGQSNAFTAGEDIGNVFGDGLITSIATQANGEFAWIVPGVVESMRRGGGGSFDVGAEVGQGFANGILSKQWEANLAASVFAGRVIESVKGKLGIHSPSKVGMELGGYFSEGFAGGILSGTGLVQSAIGSQLSLASGITLPNLTAQLASLAPGFGSAGLQAQTSGFPREITLMVDGRPMRAYIQEGVDSGLKTHFRNQQLDEWAGDA